VALARHADARELVRRQPQALAAVVSEVTRHDAPVQNTRRFVAAPGDVGGQAMQAGDTVLLVLAAANRDPAANADPARFDPARRERRSLHLQLRRARLPGRDAGRADGERRRGATAGRRRRARARRERVQLPAVAEHAHAPVRVTEPRSAFRAIRALDYTVIFSARHDPRCGALYEDILGFSPLALARPNLTAADRPTPNGSASASTRIQGVGVRS